MGHKLAMAPDTAPRPNESRGEHARRLYRQHGVTSIAELAQLYGAAPTLLVTLMGQWRAELERENRLPKRRAR